MYCPDHKNEALARGMCGHVADQVLAVHGRGMGQSGSGAAVGWLEKKAPGAHVLMGGQEKSTIVFCDV